MNAILPRRLPVYLVLDCSGSMSGEPIEATRQGMKALLSDLRSDPQALETVHLSVITFSNGASATPFAELGEFVEPQISANGSTDLGAALTLLERRIEFDCRKNSPTVKGDYKPLVFLMTDGGPTDSWEAPADALKAKRVGNIIACAAGSGADTTVLKRITENVVSLTSLEPNQLRNFFRWVSASVKVSSVGIAGKPMEMPQLPAGLTIVP
jgi:uncharacterized protein YegL